MVGELYIGGPGVAKGYRNLPVQTKAKFIIYQNKRVYRTGDYAKFDNDGNVVILGRLDGQIKLRGLRIELGEIENVIQSYGSIKEAAIAVKTIGGIEHLAAMYKGKRDHQNADKAFTFSIGFGSVASATMMLIGMLLVQPTAMIFSQGGSLYHQSTKQNGAASLFTVLEGVVFIVPLIYIFAYTNQNLMWLSFALAEIASILVIVVVMQIVAKHKKKKNFLMLDTASEQDLLDMTIQNDIEKAVEVSKEIIVFCDKNHVDPDLTNVLADSSEELAVNIVKYAYKGKKRSMSV